MSDVLIYILIAAAFLIGLVVGLLAANRRRQKPVDGTFDGYLDVSAKDSKSIYQLEIVTPPRKMAQLDSVSFKVRRIDDL